MPGYGARYWAERTPPAKRPAYPIFRGDADAEVVVIGGGLAGTTAAYVFAKAGLDVVLLEAERMACGATASGLGAILPEPDAWFRQSQAEAGVRAARAVWQEARRGARDLAAALTRIGGRGDVAAQPLIVAAPAGDATALRREQAERKHAGLDAPWLTAAATQTAIGRTSAGAIRLRDGFVFDPVRATLGFAKAAAAAGARLFEHTPVRRTRFTRQHADVVTARGRIRTSAVYVATGHPGAVFNQLARHVREQHGYVVVTEPLSAAMRRETGARRSVVREAGDAHWTRWLPEDRVLFAGALGEPAGARQLDKVLVQRTGQLMYELSVRYPAISGLPARWSWPVPVVTTADGLPWIGPHRNYPFHFFALAFGWHADSLAWFAAKAALRHFKGDGTAADRAMFR